MSDIPEPGGIVYLLTCTITRQQYVGITIVPLVTRLSQHKYQAKAGAKSKLYNAIRKYGWDSFTATILKEGIRTERALNRAEKAYIKKLNTLAPNGLNLASGGSHFQQHPETIERLREANTGKNNPNFGKSPSKKTRRKISRTQKGRVKSPQEIANISAAQKGKIIPQETRDKISAALTGRPGHKMSQSAKDAIGRAHRGRKHTGQALANMRAAGKRKRGFKHSHETKAKMSATQQARMEPVHDARRKLIARLHGEGKSYQEIIDAVGMNAAYISKCLTQLGLNRSQVAESNREKYFDIAVERMLSGESQRAISRDYGISSSEMNRWAREAGIPTLEQKKAMKIKQVLALRAQGKSAREVGRIVGISHARVLLWEKSESLL